MGCRVTCCSHFRLTVSKQSKLITKEVQVKRSSELLSKLLTFSLVAVSLSAQQSAPKIAADFDASFLKLNYQMNLGEVLGVAVNSKGTIVVLNHPGSATMGPIYGNATTQLLEFDSTASSYGSWARLFTDLATRTRCDLIVTTTCGSSIRARTL